MAKGRRSRRPARRGPARPAAPSVLALRYIETSAILAALLERDMVARASIAELGRRMTSALTFAEASRALVRARQDGRLTADAQRSAVRMLRALERRFDVVAITDAVLTRAGRPFPVEPVRTLDAIHLATVELLREPPALITVVTRDDRVRANAAALGFVVE